MKNELKELQKAIKVPGVEVFREEDQFAISIHGEACSNCLSYDEAFGEIGCLNKGYELGLKDNVNVKKVYNDVLSKIESVMDCQVKSWAEEGRSDYGEDAIYKKRKLLLDKFK